jgi:hypothetical protein
MKQTRKGKYPEGRTVTDQGRSPVDSDNYTAQDRKQGLGREAMDALWGDAGGDRI